MDNLVDVGFEADRLCDAIAKIGYEPHSAVMDIVDNSISAGARAVQIDLFLQPGKSLSNKNAVRQYRIVDDGVGMDNDGVRRAFELGSRRTYPERSLSKYGLGLKSAGLSLGTRISIVSKQDGQLTDRFAFDRDIIATAQKLVLERQPLTSEDQANYHALLPGNSGTVVELSGCERINHPSPKATVEALKAKLGVVYFSFLSNPERALELTVAVVPADGERVPENISATDLLFQSQAVSHFDPDTYDYYSPCLALDEMWTLTDRQGKPLQARIVAVAFPQHSMASDRSPLSEEKRQQVRSYKISAENAGFFVYRNGRLIRWGDPLGKIINKKDEFNIRFRLDISTELDDVLHVDVSKQRLEMDDETNGSLAAIVNKAKKTAEEIRGRCSSRLKGVQSGEGESFTYSTEHVPEDDPLELEGILPSEEGVRRRRERSHEKPPADEKDPPQTPGDPTTLVEEPPFRKIRYSDNVRYGQLYQPFYDPLMGVFVCVSKQHPFYQDFINRHPENSPERMAIEALIFAAAVAETNTRDHHVVLNSEQIDALFVRYHRNLANWLLGWTEQNADLD